MTTSIEVDVSVARAAGRRKGTSQPQARAAAMIASSSDDSTRRSTLRAPRPASTVQARRGRPPSGSMFFFGSVFEPPRAGINASTLRVPITEHLVEVAVRLLVVGETADVEPVAVDGMAAHEAAVCDERLEESRHVEIRPGRHDLERFR